MVYLPGYKRFESCQHKPYALTLRGYIRDLVDFSTFVKSINYPNDVQKNIVYYVNLHSYNILIFLFEIIFVTHSSMHFIVFGRLIHFEFVGTKKNPIIFYDFLALVTYFQYNISARIFFIFLHFKPILDKILVPTFYMSFQFHNRFLFLFFGSPSRWHTRFFLLIFKFFYSPPHIFYTNAHGFSCYFITFLSRCHISCASHMLLHSNL